MEGNPPVISLGAEDNNRGPATIGQAKWMTKCALDKLAVLDPASATKIRTLLTLPQPNPAGGPGAMFPVILDFSVPAAPVPASWTERQHAPLLLGQLKAIAKPFYDVLAVEHLDWLDAEMAANLTKDTTLPSHHYPWTYASSDDSNKSIANIGQLKSVFALHFEDLFVDVDTDRLPDFWEVKYFSDLDEDASGDFDLDGLSNGRELEIGSNPTVADTDGDGMADGYEEAYFSASAVLDPGTLTPANGPSGNADSDSFTNLQEFAKGGIPVLGNDRVSSAGNSIFIVDGQVRWYGVKDAIYRLRYSHDLSTWNMFENTMIGENRWIAVPLSDLEEPGSQTLQIDILSWAPNGDVDLDLIPDKWEILNGLDFQVSNATADPDGDGLTNQQEYTLSLNPLSSDSDNDGYPDGLSIALAGYWRLDDPDGSVAVDSSENARNGELIPAAGVAGSPSFVNDGIQGYNVKAEYVGPVGQIPAARSLAISNAAALPRLSLPKDVLNGATDFTASFWFRSATVNPTGVYEQTLLSAVSQGHTQDIHIAVSRDSSAQVMLRATVGGYLTTWGASASLMNGAWHHFALVRASGSLLGYVDGASAVTVNAGLNTALAVDTGGLIFGQKLSAPGNAISGNSWNGSIDEIRFSRQAVASAENLYFAAVDSDKDGLLDSWENAWFGHLANSGTEDSDGDGVINIIEFLQKTSPVDIFNGNQSQIKLKVELASQAQVKITLGPAGVNPSGQSVPGTPPVLTSIDFQVTTGVGTLGQGTSQQRAAIMAGAKISLDTLAVTAGVDAGSISFTENGFGQRNLTMTPPANGIIKVYYRMAAKTTSAQ